MPLICSICPTAYMTHMPHYATYAKTDTPTAHTAQRAVAAGKNGTENGIKNCINYHW